MKRETKTDGTCMFCEKTESAFCEILCYDTSYQMVRETFTTGLCADHANQGPIAHGIYAELPPVFEDRKAGLVALHQKLFGADPRLQPYSYGLRYHAKDSITGRDVRLRRMGMTNPNEARVHNPLMHLPQERVTNEEFRDAFGMPVDAKGKAFSFEGQKKKG